MPKILVADDNSNIQKMVALALKSEGIDVVAVGNGEAAVKKAIDINPDLVLADIFMPVKSGYEVCEFLKQDSRFSHVPVILLAGAFDPFDEREAQRVGADGVLKKPFVPPDPLVALVKELLAKSAEHLVGVSVPAQTPSLILNVPSATAPAASTTAPVAEASVPNAVAPQPFTPPAFVQPTPSSTTTETVEDEIDDTVITPIRDFMIPGAADQPENGGAIPFASMLETASLELEIPAVGTSGSELESGPKPAGAHSAFEGFTPWRSSTTNAVAEEESPSAEANQYMPSSKDLAGRGWQDDPSLAEKSPDETVIESSPEFSQLTHSVAHTTSVREDHGSVVEPAPIPQSAAAEDTSETAVVTPEPEPTPESRGADWRSVFHRPPTSAAQEDQSHDSSMSPWRQFTSMANAAKIDESAEAPSVAELETLEESNTPVEPDHGESADSDQQPYSRTASTDYSDLPAHEESVASDTQVSADAEVSTDVSESAEPQALMSVPESHIPETSDWISAIPQHLNPEDTTTIARSLVEGLAPAAVESMATSFPVPTGAPADPHVVEDIVARVVERMQPQILEIITREVLRPVVEALVRRQLEQKSPE